LSIEKNILRTKQFLQVVTIIIFSRRLFNKNDSNNDFFYLYNTLDGNIANKLNTVEAISKSGLEGDDNNHVTNLGTV